MSKDSNSSSQQGGGESEVATMVVKVGKLATGCGEGGATESAGHASGNHKQGRRRAFWAARNG